MCKKILFLVFLLLQICPVLGTSGRVTFDSGATEKEFKAEKSNYMIIIKNNGNLTQYQHLDVIDIEVRHNGGIITTNAANQSCYYEIYTNGKPKRILDGKLAIIRGGMDCELVVKKTQKAGQATKGEKPQKFSFKLLPVFYTKFEVTSSKTINFSLNINGHFIESNSQEISYEYEGDDALLFITSKNNFHLKHESAADLIQYEISTELFNVGSHNRKYYTKKMAYSDDNKISVKVHHNCTTYLPSAGTYTDTLYLNVIANECSVKQP